MYIYKKLTLAVVLMFSTGTVFAGDINNEKANNDLAEISQVFKSYMKKYNHFIKNQELTLSPVLYSEQVMLISGNGKSTTLTPEKMNQGVTGFLTRLKAKGVSKVAWENVEVKLLADNIAIASNVAVRFLANGDVYDRAGATYFLNKATTGWEISAFALHAPEKSLKFLSES